MRSRVFLWLFSRVKLSRSPFVSVITIKYTSLLLLPTCSDACLLSSGSLVHVPGTVTFILPSSDAISFRSVESRCTRSGSDWINADKQRGAHNTEHKRSGTKNQPGRRDASTAARAARLANFRTSNKAAD